MFNRQIVTLLFSLVILCGAARAQESGRPRERQIARNLVAHSFRIRGEEKSANQALTAPLEDFYGDDEYDVLDGTHVARICIAGEEYLAVFGRAGQLSHLFDRGTRAAMSSSTTASRAAILEAADSYLSLLSAPNVQHMIDSIVGSRIIFRSYLGDLPVSGLGALDLDPQTLQLRSVGNPVPGTRLLEVKRLTLAEIEPRFVDLVTSHFGYSSFQVVRADVYFGIPKLFGRWESREATRFDWSLAHEGGQGIPYVVYAVCELDDRSVAKPPIAIYFSMLSGRYLGMRPSHEVFALGMEASAPNAIDGAVNAATAFVQGRRIQLRPIRDAKGDVAALSQSVTLAVDGRFLVGWTNPTRDVFMTKLNGRSLFFAPISAEHSLQSSR